MTAGREKIIRWATLALCCVILTVCSVAVLNRKEAFFLDEYSSYGCANGTNGKIMDYQVGVAYTPEEIHQMEAATYIVPQDNRFRFDNVWKNLSNNVHPPVFYALLHLVCSLTPGMYNIWQAAAVNLLFGLISLIFFQKLARALFRKEWLGALLCLGWVCTMGLYGNIAFLRDYAAAMCACLIAGWEVFRYLNGHRKLKDLAKIALASAFCALSHYYCLIYLFFLCAVLCVTLMIRKEWKAVGLIVAAEAAAAGISLAVFPSMIERVLGSRRGVEATANLVKFDLALLKKRLTGFFETLSTNFFGGFLLYALILLAVLIILSLVLRGKIKAVDENASDVAVKLADVLLLLLPAAFFAAIIVKIAPNDAIRYLYPVVAFLYLGGFAAVAYFGKSLVSKKVLAIGLALMVVLMSGFSWKNGKIRYLYQGNRQRIQENLEPIRGTDAILIWGKSTNYPSVTLPQVDYYGSVTFLNKTGESRLADIPALLEGKDAVILLGKDTKEAGFKDKLLEIYPEYRAVELGNLDGQNRFFNYWFHKN